MHRFSRKRLVKEANTKKLIVSILGVCFFSVAFLFIGLHLIAPSRLTQRVGQRCSLSKKRL